MYLIIIHLLLLFYILLYIPIIYLLLFFILLLLLLFYIQVNIFAHHMHTYAHNFCNHQFPHLNARPNRVNYNIHTFVIHSSQIFLTLAVCRIFPREVNVEKKKRKFEDDSRQHRIGFSRAVIHYTNVIHLYGQFSLIVGNTVIAIADKTISSEIPIT